MFRLGQRACSLIVTRGRVRRHFIRNPRVRSARWNSPQQENNRVITKSCPALPPSEAPNGILDAQQKEAVRLAQSGINLFITGGAGTGKSLCVHAVRNALVKMGRNVVVTGTTGVSALHVGGMTIHAFSGIGRAEGSDAYIVSGAVSRSRHRWINVESLIIDEVSMLSARTFQLLDKVARRCRRSSEPMGGVQVILCGDFLQLPPVDSEAFAFESSIWKELNPRPLMLTKSYRQVSDPAFCSVLDEIRVGECNPSTIELLTKASSESSSTATAGSSVVLASRNRAVDSLNDYYFDSIFPFTATDATDDSPIMTYTAVESLHAKHRGSVEFFSHSVIPASLKLKRKTRVMLLYNQSIPDGLVNGAVGEVLGFATPCDLVKLAMHARTGNAPPSFDCDTVLSRSGLKHPREVYDVIVSRRRSFRTISDKMFNVGDMLKIYATRGSPTSLLWTPQSIAQLSGKKEPTNVKEAAEFCDTPEARLPLVVFPSQQGVKLVHVGPHLQTVAVGDVVIASRVQLPLRPAWSITIHKSQGMTLPAVDIDMKGIFAVGQAYVALSRAMSMKNVRLRNFSPSTIQTSHTAKKFYDTLIIPQDDAPQEEVVIDTTVDEEVSEDEG